MRFTISPFPFSPTVPTRGSDFPRNKITSFSIGFDWMPIVRHVEQHRIFTLHSLWRCRCKQIDRTLYEKNKLKQSIFDDRKCYVCCSIAMCARTRRRKPISAKRNRCVIISLWHTRARHDRENFIWKSIWLMQCTYLSSICNNHHLNSCTHVNIGNATLHKTNFHAIGSLVMAPMVIPNH